MTESNDDPGLLPRVAQGDAEAVRACLDRFAPLVWSLARRLVPDRHEAEDAVQEIFVELWKSAARYDAAMGSETTFVATIARRRLIDRRRRAGRRPDTDTLDDARPPVDESAPFEERVELEDEAAVAADALRELRPEQQRVISLSVYEGLTHQEISESTGMPLGTVKTHVRRGLIRVRELLEAKRRAPPVSGSRA